MNLHMKMSPRGFSTTMTTKLFFIVAILLLGLAPHASAQETDDPAQTQRREEMSRRDSTRGRGSRLFEQLNLTPEQVRQLREIRMQNEVEARGLARRLHETRRALDEAIYADSLDEALIEQRTREVETAQAALVKLRASTELKVRRTLTPEQLQTFKALRQEARRQQRERRRGEPGERPSERRRRGRDAFNKP